MNTSNKNTMLKRFGLVAISAAVVIACVILFPGIFGNNVANAGGDLMKDISPAKISSVKLDDNFIKSSADFSVDILKKSITKGSNSLISPTSVYLALAMTANGADGSTLKEFESVLGKYNLKIGDINKYSFAALLPSDGISADDYVSTLTGDKFLSIIKNKANAAVNTGIPKFKSTYAKSLVEPLKAMGLKECFDGSKANFGKMGSYDKGKLFVGDVLHKTYIEVGELGTKAGAVTSVKMSTTSMPLEIKSVILNRPFVYAIIDNETSLPVFIGVMHNPQ